MGFFGSLFRRIVPKLIGKGLPALGQKFGTMAVDKAKEAAINLAKQKAAEAAANAAKAVADKTGITGLVGQDAVNQGAGALGGAVSQQAGNFFQK
jgi:hypothetical protein